MRRDKTSPKNVNEALQLNLLILRSNSQQLLVTPGAKAKRVSKIENINSN